MRTAAWIATTVALWACDDTITTGDGGSGGAGSTNTTTTSTGAGAGPSTGAMGGSMQPPPPPRVLIFTKTLGYRHPSINDGIQAVGQAGYARGWTVEHTEDAARFLDLGDIDVVLFLSTTGSVLDAEQQAAFMSFIRAGGGYAGVHAASDTHYDWPWYGELVGAFFDTHWSVVETRLIVEDSAHPSTSHLGADWLRTDEWYRFQTNPRGEVDVLMHIDLDHYTAQGAPPEVQMLGDHPIAWYHEFDGGRAFYTALGHTPESYAEPAFIDHVTGGVEWAAGHETPLGP